MAETLTLPNLKRVTTSEEFLILAKAVFTTMAAAQATRERVDKLIIPLFKSLGFTYGKKLSSRDSTRVGKPIEHPDHSYLSDDDELFREYMVLCREAYIREGFDFEDATDEQKRLYIESEAEPVITPPMGTCPALVAENMQRQAENLLLEYMREAIGMPEWRRLEDRQKMLDLYLGLAAKGLQ